MIKHAYVLARKLAGLIIVLVLGVGVVTGQPATGTIPTARLREDFALLRAALTEAHAGLYVYQSPQAMARIFDSVSAALRDTTALGFFDAVTGLLAQIRDGHTRALPSEQWMAWYGDSARVLPFRVRMVRDRGWVMASADSRIPRGSEVLAIDGRPMGRIASRISSRLPADGYVETGKLAQLSAQFELWYYLYESRADSFRVDIRRPGGATTRVQGAAVPIRAIPSDTQPLVALSFLDDSTIAVLRLSTFAAGDIAGAGLDYPRFLDSAFATIADARTSDLIIDLQGNDGGRDVFGSMLMSRLSRRPFEYYRSLEAHVNGVTFWRHTNVDSTFNARFGAGLTRGANGRYELPVSRHPNLATQQPKEPAFGGRVWVLVDGGTFSAGAEFASVARSLGRATFIGEETGGTYEGNTSGTFVILNLPNSGLRVVVPLVRYHLAVQPARTAGRGIMPDHVVNRGTDGSNTALERALSLIRARRGNPR